VYEQKDINTEVQKEIHVEVPYLTITLTKNIISYTKLVQLLHNKIDENREEFTKRQITLFGVIVTIREEGAGLINIETCMLDIKRHKYDKELIWSQYVANNKQHLRKIINTGQFNLLLHGPPGTGKSKLIETTAKMLERHVISLNLKHCSKYNLLQILNKPRFYDRSWDAKDVIYVLEEFDQVVDYLIMKKKMQSVGIKKSCYSDQSTNLIEDSKKYANELFLGDLLEMFQSSIPREGQIIIATTNNYERIRKILPALFRPGRLTPIYIGYMTQSTYNETVEQSFGQVDKKIELPPEHNIPTSEITELIRISAGDYETFYELMMTVISRSKPVDDFVNDDDNIIINDELMLQMMSNSSNTNQNVQIVPTKKPTD
jgi:SpoVK/Ycf46/Vps4 family AAA+-type ATPase